MMFVVINMLSKDAIFEVVQWALSCHQITSPALLVQNIKLYLFNKKSTNLGFSVHLGRICIDNGESE